MILSHTHKFIFFCSSKVGTTSMEEVLWPLQEGAEYDFGSPEAGFGPKHVPPAILRGALPERVWRDYFKFVFVRNPWDWFVSQWFYNSLGSRPYEHARLTAQTAPTPSGVRSSARRAVRALARRAPAAPVQSLLPIPTDGYELSAADVDSVFDLLKRFKGLPGRPGAYQSNWVYDMDDRVAVDYVGRYETLEADFAEAMRHLKLDLALPHLNRTEHRDFRSYYSSEARDRVGELWDIDVKNFGYSFEPTVADDNHSAHP